MVLAFFFLKLTWPSITGQPEHFRKLESFCRSGAAWVGAVIFTSRGIFIATCRYRHDVVIRFLRAGSCLPESLLKIGRGNALVVRDQVSIALRHFEALVSHHFPDGDQGFPLDGQPRGEGVPERVEGDLLPEVRDTFVQAEPINGPVKRI